MAKAKVFTGGRAKLFVDDVLVAIFDSCTYAVNIGAEAQHILGRYGPAEDRVREWSGPSASFRRQS